jgi:FixJ family two-component response regulator
MTDEETRVGVIGIVDDDDPLRKAIESVLRASKFTIESYASAEAFLDSPSRDRIQCLILDVRLPGMSGIELQRRLRDANDQMPILFISAHGDEILRQRVMSAGAVGFLSKPVRSGVLLEHIRTVLAESHNRR